MIFLCVGVVYSGEYDAYDVTLSVYNSGCYANYSHKVQCSFLILPVLYINN
jgi:hypothetical protein